MGNFTCMSITLPEDKKKVVDKEIKAVEAKLEVVGRFKDTVKVIEDFCAALVNFDNSLKAVDGWKDTATAELKDIKEASGAMPLRIVWPGPWICRRTLPPSLRF